MEQQRRRSRLRISTLMLLIGIAALLFERWRREREMRRTEAEAVTAEAIARQAEYNMALIKALSDQERATPQPSSEPQGPTKDANR